MDGILGIKNRFFWFSALTEGTDVVVDSIAGDVWEAKYEITGSFNDGVESCYLLCL